jgi:hypothetical protein
LAQATSAARGQRRGPAFGIDQAASCTPRTRRYLTDSRVENVLRDQGQMEGDRGNWESHWQEAAERVLPRQRDFNQMKRAGGEKLSEKVFDSTAPMALEKFAAVMEGTQNNGLSTIVNFHRVFRVWPGSLSVNS